jgi:uncharacterized membrane protein YraQ (UPF0718 family)
MTFFISLMGEVWNILLDASFFILLGIVIAGFLKVSLNPNTILEHLGKGRFVSVIKAAFFGVPLPL